MIFPSVEAFCVSAFPQNYAFFEGQGSCSTGVPLASTLARKCHRDTMAVGPNNTCHTETPLVVLALLLIKTSFTSFTALLYQSLLLCEHQLFLIV